MRYARYALASTVALTLLGSLSCSKKPTPSDPSRDIKEQQPEDDNGVRAPKPATLSDVTFYEDLNKPTTMSVTLIDGSPQKEGSGGALARPKTSNLDRSRTDALLSRMTALVQEEGDQVDFAKREKSLPPPKTGDTIETPFPPKSSYARPEVVAADTTSPLKVLRFAPEGEVPLAPHVSVTFDKPMVAVTSHKDTVAAGVPVKITPEVKGDWRWVGAKTVLFEAPKQTRLPMATEYTVDIPEGTKSKNGNTIAEAKSWTFKTPPAKVTTMWPQYGQRPLDQKMFLGFNQKIDPEKMLEHVQVKSGVIFGGRQVVRLTPEEIDADPDIKRMAESANPDTWVAFKATSPLAYGSSVRVVVGKGAPSAEGPLLTDSAQSYSFSTYGAFVVSQARCGWGGRCRPNDSFTFEFSNPIDTESFDASTVKVEPSFPGMNIYAAGRYIYINGMKPGRRKYTVTIPPEVQDVYDQKLGKEYTHTFDVGIADPSLSSTGGSFVVLDPSTKEPAYTVFSTNYAKLRVQLYEVDHTNWKDYLEYYRDYNYYGKHTKTPPGKPLSDKIIDVVGEPDDIIETKIKLAEALGGDGLGNLVIVIEPAEVVDGATMPTYKPKLRAWVQATQIGLDAFVDKKELIGWATSLKGGEPMSGVELEIGGGVKGKTNDKGISKLALPATQDNEHAYLLAKKDKDVAFLPEQVWSNYSTWYKQGEYDSLSWFVFDDRAMYRPDEEVHIKGWMRIRENKEGGDIQLPKFDGKKITYKVYGPQRNELASGEVDIRGLGGFDFKFKLPKTPNLGRAWIEMRTVGTSVYGSHTHYFQIQEFRRPEFSVSASAPAGPFLQGEDATVSVEAKYYAGGALPNADTTWNVTTSQGYFSPPNQSKYSFGSWVPWWVTWNTPSSGQSSYESFQGKTDVTGNHHLKLDFGEIDPPRPVSITASATVMDVNRQAWNTSTSLLVHPSLTYVGMRSDKYFVKKGEPLEIKLIVADIDGKQLGKRPVKVRAARTQWTYKDGAYKEEQVDPQDCEIMTEAEAESTCKFKTAIGGTYKITATTVDDYGRGNFSQITRWVSGGKTPVARRVEQERVQLIPDKDLYQPGDTANILVQSPFTPAEGILTLRRNGITQERRFTMAESTTTLDIPIMERHLPNLYVQVDLVGSAPRLNEKGEKDESLPRRPAYAQGQIKLKIPPLERKLEVEVTPAKDKLEPGAKTSVEVLVKDAKGKAVKDAEVAIVVVDESILALSSYAMADPLALFYAERPADARDHHLRGSILLIDPAKLRAQNAPGGDAIEGKIAPAKLRKKSGGSRGSSRREMSKADNKPAAPAPMEEAEEAPMDDAFAANMDMDKDGELSEVSDQTGKEGGGAIKARVNFNPLADFSPAVRTDASGKAKIDFALPDNLTRYRVMAVAVEGGKRYGKGEGAITARLPLMVRPSAPRFLNFGDKFELPVVLQNQTDEVMEVELATRATNIEMIGANGFKVSVPANDRVEVRFPATTAMAGTARFQVAASAGSWNDGTEFDLPVWTPATSEAFATYGVIDKGSIAQPVKMPGEVWPQFGGLEVTTSSTALQALTDAFIYIYHYEYQCAEQISSRVLTIAALRDVLKAFKAKDMPSDAAIQASMAKDIDELISRQNYDGGFGLWRRGQPSWPYVSLHASHALARAKEKGYEVPEYNLNQLKNYLRSIESHIPSYYSEWTRRTIIAYALYVRAILGERDPAYARRLIARAGSLDGLSFETLGWLMLVMTGDAGSSKELADIRKYLGNRVTETAGAAHFARSFSDGAYLIMHSDRRADGIILEALIKDSPKSDLIPKIVKGLMAHRTRGRWGNTQENAFILLALDLYFNTFEKQTPDFFAKIWLGDTFAGQHQFKGRTTEEHKVSIPMNYIAKTDGEQNIYLQKDGKGRMYYRVGMNYAPKDLFIEAADQGFVVERVYEPVDNDEDVRREADGTWVFKAGAKVKVTLTMVAPTRRYHVALVDPLPAGIETLNPALAVTGDVPQDTSSTSTSRGWWWWSRPWYEHQNMRDERTEAFTTLLWGGVHTYSYYARATTPGEFIVPPAKAEEMYAPETFGRSSSDRVKVVD